MPVAISQRPLYPHLMLMCMLTSKIKLGVSGNFAARVSVYEDDDNNILLSENNTIEYIAVFTDKTLNNENAKSGTCCTNVLLLLLS